jgi:pimeloyl-ACP methyl ester carboxylesterase
MAPRRRAGKRIFRTFLPILLLIFLAASGATTWIVYSVTHPPQRSYLVTPEKFTQLSARGLKATEEKWTNRDGTEARGWLLKGGQGSPAVVLVHRYDANRSWYLNMGVKLNEATNFTVLLPDLRGHGENGPALSSTLGMKESDDIIASVDYLKSLKGPGGAALVGDKMGVFGAGLGAYAALKAAASNKAITALALDSVPANPDELLSVAVKERLGINNRLLQSLARAGMRAYLLGNYQNVPACSYAAGLHDRKVLLLSGPDAGPFQASTAALQNCIPRQNPVEARTDLPLTGYNLHPSTGEQAESYDRRVIEFFDIALISSNGQEVSTGQF